MQRLYRSKAFAFQFGCHFNKSSFASERCTFKLGLCTKLMTRTNICSMLPHMSGLIPLMRPMLQTLRVTILIKIQKFDHYPLVPVFDSEKTSKCYRARCEFRVRLWYEMFRTFQRFHYTKINGKNMWTDVVHPKKTKFFFHSQVWICSA